MLWYKCNLITDYTYTLSFDVLTPSSAGVATAKSVSVCELRITRMFELFFGPYSLCKGAHHHGDVGEKTGDDLLT